MVSKSPSRWLLFILLIGFALRLTWALLQPSTEAAIDRLPDQREYFTLGRNLLHERSLRFVDPRFDQTIWAYRMPGYPAFLAMCGGSISAARLVQCLLDLSTVCAVFLIARQLSDNAAAAAIAAALMAINPFYVYFSSLILTETLFATLLAWSIWLLIRRRWAFASFLLVSSCVVRPSALLLAPVMVGLATANSAVSPAYPLVTSIRRGIVGLVGTMLLLGICLLPWAWRNHQLIGSWVWTTTNAGITVYDGFNPTATGGSDQRFIVDFPQLRSMNEVQRSRFFEAEARRWAFGHLTKLPALSVRKILRGWSPVPLSAEFGRPLYRMISAAYALPFDLLVLVGLLSRQLTWRNRLLLAMPAVIVTLEQLLSVGSIRYRMPAEAPLAVLAAVGAIELLKTVGFLKQRTNSGTL